MLFTAICRRSEESHSSLRPGTGAASSRLALPACGGAGREPLVRAASLPTSSVASSLIPSLSLPSGVNRRAVGRARVRRPSGRARAGSRDPPCSSRRSSRCATRPYWCSDSGATSTPRNRPRGRASSVNGSRPTPRSRRPRSAVCRSVAEVRASTLRSPTVLLRSVPARRTARRREWGSALLQACGQPSSRAGLPTPDEGASRAQAQHARAARS